MAVLGERRRRLERQRHLGAGRDQDDVRSGRLPSGLPEHVGAALDAGSVGAATLAAVEHRHVLARQRRARPGPSARSSATFQAYVVSFASAGRITQRFGIARSAARCSTGWCVGPSSPSPTESCVQTQTTGRFMSADRRTRGSHVVAEDEERRAVRLHDAAVERDAVDDRAHARARGRRTGRCGRRSTCEKTPAPSNAVLVDSTRSAAPPTIVGAYALERLHHRGAGGARGQLRLLGRIEASAAPPPSRARGSPVQRLVPVLGRARGTRRARRRSAPATRPRAPGPSRRRLMCS